MFAPTKQEIDFMLETKGQLTPSIEGIDQQDFTKIQLLSGAYPNKVGLQQRIPGKTLDRQVAFAVGSIGVMYNVYGRFFSLENFGTTLNITQINIPPYTPPGLPPNSMIWFDDFSAYSPNGLIQLIWGAGIWDSNFGVCQSIIAGFMDPFAINATITTNPPWVPIRYLTETPEIPPVDPNSPAAMYPPGSTNVVLGYQIGVADNSCTGQGSEPVDANDSIEQFDVPAPDPVLLDTLYATDATIGKIIIWNGLRVGRIPDRDLGTVQGTCPGPPQPVPTNYYLIQSTGDFGVET